MKAIKIILLLFVHILGACNNYSEKVQGFVAASEGGSVSISLPYRHAGWNLSLRDFAITVSESEVEVVVANNGAQEIYLKSQEVKRHLSKDEKITVYSGSIQDAQEKMTIFVASDKGDLDLTVWIVSPQRISGVESGELFAYSSDGP